MSIVDSDGPPSWSLDASETGEWPDGPNDRHLRSHGKKGTVNSLNFSVKTKSESNRMLTSSYCDTEKHETFLHIEFARFSYMKMFVVLLSHLPLFAIPVDVFTARYLFH